MKRVVTTISAAIFALGLTTAGLAQTTQTPAQPEVKKESTAVQTPAAKPEVSKPGEKAGAKEAAPCEAKKETKKLAKKVAKKDKTEKKSGAPVAKSQPEKQ